MNCGAILGFIHIFYECFSYISKNIFFSANGNLERTIQILTKVNWAYPNPENKCKTCEALWAIQHLMQNTFEFLIDLRVKIVWPNFQKVFYFVSQAFGFSKARCFDKNLQCLKYTNCWVSCEYHNQWRSSLEIAFSMAKLAKWFFKREMKIINYIWLKSLQMFCAKVSAV